MGSLKCLTLMLLLVLAFSLRKQQPLQKNRFNFGSCYLPRPDKVAKGGDDANFESENLLAVADGVGGWEAMGIDPSKYSKKLVSEVAEAVKNSTDSNFKELKNLMQTAWTDDKELGSSTFLLVSLDPHEPTLYTSQVGDSGLAVYGRQGTQWEVVHPYQSYQMQFNMPYQLAANPLHGNDPQVAVERALPIKHNDIIVMGSDGLFDNMYDNSIINVLRDYAPNGVIEDPKVVAKVIAEAAQKYSLDNAYLSPFATHAREAGFQFTGGKSDDITVIVAQVKLQ